LAGADTIPEVVTLQQRLQHTFEIGGFTLHKWNYRIPLHFYMSQLSYVMLGPVRMLPRPLAWSGILHVIVSTSMALEYGYKMSIGF
jgi:hypothetical protein